jgi:hypothetical protein
VNEAKVVNDVDAALGGTRVLRLALNVLYDGMEELYGEAGTGLFQDAMAEVHARLCRVEADALARCGVAEFFTIIIKPSSPLSPAAPEVRAAVRTLERHGWLELQSDALIRDWE